MRYPPSLTFTPAASWVYRTTASLIAILLIANFLYFTSGNHRFSLLNWVLGGLCTLSILWLLHDAWRPVRGSLHYTQGQWYWGLESADQPGTLRLHLDLQNYMLVSFLPHSSNNKFFPNTTQWFHLEARHAPHGTGNAAWLALRRAVHANVESGHEAVVS